MTTSGVETLSLSSEVADFVEDNLECDGYLYSLYQEGLVSCSAEVCL